MCRLGSFPYWLSCWLQTSIISASIIFSACETQKSFRSDKNPESDRRDVTPDPTLTYYNFAKPVFDRSCVACHGATALNFRLDSYDDVAEVAGIGSTIARIEEVLLTGTMPPNPEFSLSDEEHEKLLAWISAGAAQGERPDCIQSDPVAATFVRPAALRERPGSDYVVEIKTCNHAEDAEYTLFATRDMSNRDGAVPLVEGRLRSGEPIRYGWVDQQLEPGEYFLYLRIGENIYDSHGSIIVDEQTPTISLDSAWDARQVFVAGQGSVVVRYAASDPNQDSLDVSLEVSDDSGETWRSAECSPIDADRCEWKTEGLDQGMNFRLRVTVEDEDGNRASDSSAVDFCIAAADYRYGSQEVRSVLATCAGSYCHSSGGSFAFMFNIDVYDGPTGVYAKRDRIIARAVVEETMPVQNGTSVPLPKEQQDVLQIWLWQGAQ